MAGTPDRASNAGDMNSRDFRPISHFILETVQHRTIVIMEG